MYLADINFMLRCASVLHVVIQSLYIKAEKLEVIDSLQNHMVNKLSEKQFTNMSDYNVISLFPSQFVPLC